MLSLSFGTNSMFSLLGLPHEFVGGCKRVKLSYSLIANVSI